MGIRINIEIQRRKGQQVVQTPALLNSGYESEIPELLLPAALAQRLGLSPDLPEEAQSISYETAGGITQMYRIEGALNVRALVQGRDTDTVICSAAISELEREAILSDAAIEKLCIEVFSPHSGKWKFIDEKDLRDSVARRLW
jgi:hypothetical protein